MSKKNKSFTLEVGKAVATEKVAFKQPDREPSVYAPVLDAVRGLKPGQTITVSVPKDAEPRTIQNRLSSAIRNAKISAPDGHLFRKRMTEDGKLAISVEAGAPTKRRKKPSADASK